MIDVDELALDKYQVMPDLSNEEYAALKRDIRENGVRTDIDVDENNNVIDGHHRVRACRELSIEKIEARVHVGLSSKEKQDLAWRLNMQRRHLEQGQKRELAKEYLIDSWDGETTEREIADLLGIGKKTVNRAKKDLREAGKLSHLTQLTTSEKKEIVREYIEDHPDASNREIADSIDCDVSHVTVGRWRKDKDDSDSDCEDVSDSDSNSDEDDSNRDDEDNQNQNTEDSDDEDEKSSLTLRNATDKELEKLQEIREKADEGNEVAQKQLEKLQSNSTSIHTAHKHLEKHEAEKEVEKQRQTDGGAQEYQPKITQSPALEFIQKYEDKSVDLLLTDPPYSTDVEDIEEFAEDWLPEALSKVKDDGYAYVFVGSYTEEIHAYLSVLTDIDRFESQILIWTYKNTLGKVPKNRYSRNYQAVLYLRGSETQELNAPKTSEQWAVQDINAPDGRHQQKHHRWQKPEKLIERFVRHTTEEGDLVVDPFAGSGTTLLTAAELARETEGCDKDSQAIETARERGCVVE
ncbi:DNA methyltransferase (plasmid) [Halorutilales archaeon Cl-col2-1]